MPFLTKKIYLKKVLQEWLPFWWLFLGCSLDACSMVAPWMTALWMATSSLVFGLLFHGCSWIAPSWMAALWMATYFEQVKKCWSFWWIWEIQKFTLQQTSLMRNWMSEQVTGLLIHVTITPPWLLRPVKVSTSPGPYPNCFRLHTFLNCSGI